MANLIKYLTITQRIDEVELKKLFVKVCFIYMRIINFVHPMPDGVTGNTSDFGSEESRFEP